MMVLDEVSLIEVACDTRHVSALLKNGEALTPTIRGAKVRTARVIRHKHGKRCLIKYQGMDSSGKEIQFLGKIRFKGLDRKSAAIQQKLAALHRLGAEHASAQTVDVPNVYGELPSLNMWLQEFVHGDALPVNSANFIAAQPRVAQALARLHQTHVPNLGQHTIDHELALLQKRFQQLKQKRPELSPLVGQLEVKVANIGDELRPGTLQTTIHRDFYFDQVLLTGVQCTLVDLDLCCFGPPELDVGNYIGHLREYAIRHPRFNQTCQAAEQSFAHTYFERMPHASRKLADLWAVLTLARHVSLSTIIAGRSHTTLTLADRILWDTHTQRAHGSSDPMSGRANLRSTKSGIAPPKPRVIAEPK